MAQLEPDQEALLSRLCEAARSVPKESRGPFTYMGLLEAHDLIIGPGLPQGGAKVTRGDLPILERAGFVQSTHVDRHSNEFMITPEGYAHWQEMRRRSGEPTSRVELNVRQYLDSDAFRRSFGAAYDKWAQAEDLMWAGDSNADLTTIGHLCREAMQLFATALVEQHNPPGVEPDPTKTKARVRAVLDQHRETLSKAVMRLLDALLNYWEALVDLGQRQEHGGQKEGEPLAPEDARRLVFQTAIVMFELVRVLPS